MYFRQRVPINTKRWKFGNPHEMGAKQRKTSLADVSQLASWIAHLQSHRDATTNEFLIISSLCRGYFTACAFQ